VIDSEYEEALDGLKNFSHFYVLFHLHEADRPFKTKIHPTGKPELPLVGVFATITPNRLNPIAQSLDKLPTRKGNILIVELDKILTPKPKPSPQLPSSHSLSTH
jgi:tRNA (Thr-GGU) A37 N-methylase